MKKIFLFICSCVFCFAFGHASSNTSSYYYSLGKKCELSRIESKLAFQKSSNIDREEFLQTLPLRSTNHDIEWRGNDICIIEYNDTLEVSQFKRDLLFRGLDSITIWPVYTINQYTEAILFREILVKPKSFINIDTLVTRYGLTLKSDKGNYLVYSVHKDSDVIFVANQIYETGMCEFSYPHFGTRVQSFSYIPNDTYFPYQITCHNTGQTLPNGHFGSSDADIDAPEAWDITKGSPDVIIAVFDEGVTSNHPDLPNSRQIRLNGSNFGSGNVNDPSPTGDSNHGNACAGVIAATMDNNEGIAGIAPNCKIMPLRWDGASSDTEMADGIYFAVNNGANIISCSWGSVNPYYTSDVIYNAINTAIAQNVIVIFAAGNTANHAGSSSGFVSFPANANIPNLITVGASDRNDHMANYSPKSSLIDFVAPSHRAYPTQITGETFEMWSLDIPGNSGYNPIQSDLSGIAQIPAGTMIPSSGTNYLSYTGCFGGTSHACPVVAGVVALMLSVDSTLTPAKVYNILKETSDKIGGYTYINGKCDEVGYGRINADAAVIAAAGGYIQGPDYVCDTAKYYLIHPSQPGDTVLWTVNNGNYVYPHYSIIGADNQDTVYIKCERANPVLSNSPNLQDNDASNDRQSLAVGQSVSVTISNGTSETYTKEFRDPIGAKPEVSVSNSSLSWNSGTSRTFTITNCTNVPDTALTWEVKKTVVYTNGNPSSTTYSYYTGRTLTYQASTPKSSTTLLQFTITNTLRECEPKSVVLNYAVTRPFFMTAYDEGNILHVMISENENAEASQQTTEDRAPQTLELWHNIYGCMRTQPVRSNHEQIDITGLTQGVYVLLLKENGEVIEQTKVNIY